MGILFGAISALLFGASDVSAARASKTSKPIAVTRTALLVALLYSPLFILWEPVNMSTADVVYTVLSGVGNGLALLTLYVGYTRSPIGVVAPVAAVLTALVPVLIDLVRGNGVSVLGGCGVALGVAAVALSSYQPTRADVPAVDMRAAVLVGTLAGGGFGLSFALLSLTRDEAGLATVPVQRITGLVVLLLVHPFMRAPILSTHKPGRRFAILTGLMAGAALASLKLGYRSGDAGPVSVAASQFAAVTVLLAALVNHERLRWWQSAGLGLASVGVGLMAIG